ncbi:MAG: hypothetical protein WBE78_11235 [Candidatus Binataceae bacterium]
MQGRDFRGVLRMRSAVRGLLYAASAILAVVACGAVSPAWSGQSLWVANNESANLEQFKHSQLKSTGIPRPSLIGLSGDPLGISFDRKGNLWTTVGSTQVQEISAKQLIKAGNSASPTPAAVITSCSSFHSLVGSNFDAAGDLWIADSSGAIYELSAAQLKAGTADLVPAITLTASGNFESPQFVTFDNSGDLWVSDENASAVFEFTPDQLVGGNQTPRVITDGLAGPGQLAFDHKKNLWVTNFDNSTVVEYSKADLVSTINPAPATAITSPNNILNGAWGLAFDVGDDMWVANYSTGAIMKFGPVQLMQTHPLRPKVFLGGANNFSYQITFGPTS